MEEFSTIAIFKKDKPRLNKHKAKLELKTGKQISNQDFLNILLNHYEEGLK